MRWKAMLLMVAVMGVLVMPTTRVRAAKVCKLYLPWWDCNENGIDDRCDLNCNALYGNCFPCSWIQECGERPDCNANDEPDECDIAEDCAGDGGPFYCTVDCDPDYNENCVIDECEDCDGDGIADQWEDDVGYHDCNTDGVCNAAEIAACVNDPACADCNENGIPDGCEDVPFWSSSAKLPLGYPLQETYTLYGAPKAAGEYVTISFSAVGDLDDQGESEFVWVYINDALITPIFDGVTNACGEPAAEDAIMDLSACDYNDLLDANDGDLEITMEASYDAGQEDCESGYIKVTLEYATAEDCNQDDIPDACEIWWTCAAACGPFFCTENCDPDLNENCVPDNCEPDCNGNGAPDALDIDNGTSENCNGNTIPDECEIDENSTAPGGPFYCTENCDPDCNNTGIPDECEVPPIAPDGADCNADGTPDECEIDENSTAPGGPFFCTENCDPDCNETGIPDECEVPPIDPEGDDCNGDGIPDECEIDENSTAPGGPFFCTENCDPDCNNTGIPDECEVPPIDPAGIDCNANGIPDDCEIDANSTAPGGPFFCTENCDPDCNETGIPDECEVPPIDLVGVDCNANSTPDECEIDENSTAPGGPFFCSQDCACDCNDNGIPDECDEDVNEDDIPDDCELADAVGGLWLRVTPAFHPDLSAGPLMILRVAPSFTEGACVFMYVRDDGTLGTLQEAHEATPENWGTVYIRGGCIAPDKSYYIEARSPQDVWLAEFGEVTTWKWADWNNDGVVEQADCDLFGAAQTHQDYGCSTIHAFDLAPPCDPNGSLNVDDFQLCNLAVTWGNVYCDHCPESCTCAE